MGRITLDGVKLRTFTPPPPGFDPLSASAMDLLAHGFPARPDNPQQLELYHRVFNRIRNRFQYIQPEFEISKNTRRVPKLSPVPAVGTGNEFHNLWSGGVVVPPAGQSFRWIVGEWTVSNVAAPTEGQTYYCATWVGIDGNVTVQSTDLCQAGINTDVTRKGTSNTRHCYAWCEWFPGPEVTIPNFPVTFGDTVQVLVCTSGVGATEATIYFINITSGVTTSLVLDAPAQVSLVGDSAQWVVERPQLTEDGTTTFALLPDYGQVFFSGCQAESFSQDGSSSTVVGGGTQVRIDMVEAATGNTPLSNGFLVADEVIQCVWVASGDGRF